MISWLPSECAPRGYPVLLLRGALLSRDAVVATLDEQSVFDNGWGRTGATRVIGPDAKPIPDGLLVRWYSYAEDRIYEGRFELDEPTVRRAFEAGFSAGMDAPRREFDRILIGFAPGGGVAVWVAGAGAVREVAWFRAKAVEGPSAEVPASVDRTLVLQQFRPGADLASAEDPLALERWVRYREREAWSPSVIGSTGVRELWIELLNGEREAFGTTGRELIPPAPRALPSRILLTWEHPGGKSILRVVDLNERDVEGAFRRLRETTSDAPFSLQVEVDNASVALTASVRRDRQRVPIRVTVGEP